MKYQERIDMMNGLDPENLKGNAKDPYKAEASFRYYQLQLLADIAESASSFAYSQSQLLKLQQKRAGVTPPARQSGEGQ